MKRNISIHKAEANKGVLDFSHLLDAPAGKHGFVRVKKGHFYFEDGIRCRFLGFNVAARSNTPDHETADKMAERFASMGVNIIRLHAADAPVGEEPGSWSSCKEAPLLNYQKENGREFNKKGLDRFDYFVAKLKEKGIYLHIDLIVARDFREGDGLDYPGNPGSCVKRFPMYNKRMIELQKEYAKMILCHINPYTGLALIDDPAVVVVQINNEESAISGTMGTDGREDMQPYRDEVQKRFNHFLLMKYGTREQLKKAWTNGESCALRCEEDPEKGTVLGVDGEAYQPVNDPASEWDSGVNSARYADFMEFGIWINRNFYQRMKDYLHSLGVKVPIVTSNLLTGAADIYGHMDGDIIENNSYFNHPLLPVQNNTYHVLGPREYVSVNPLTMQKGGNPKATTLLSLASMAALEGKPFMLSEWNEYGLHPFHSTSLVHTVAYACLNDWDGLILYNHHTSEHWDDQPEDKILNIFDVYNDPAVVCQWGFMASVFLKGLINVANNRVDVVYTQNDLRTLPVFHAMPSTFFPYVTAMRNVFLDGGDSYRGDADVAINAGFLNGADLSDAKHGVYYAWSLYRDAWRKNKETNRLEKAAKGTREIQRGVHLGRQALVFDEIAKIAENGDYSEFAKIMDQAMKEWGVLQKNTGFIEGKFISDTKEIVFDPANYQYKINTTHCAYFSGMPNGEISLSDRIMLEARNERITLALLGVDGKAFDDSREYILTAMGNTGMDETVYQPGPEQAGRTFTTVILGGRLYVETLEGVLYIKAEEAELFILSPVGNVLAKLEGSKSEKGICFVLDGDIPGVQYHLIIKS
ncbi:MAG TPA: hypothetical protein DFI63_06660 [Lachnospiraceae bacterium]|jgi:hypothetical protein|nr:hypothetical protein [Lachnospiraceae bacterium]